MTVYREQQQEEEEVEVTQADPELERLLAEEEEIEARATNSPVLIANLNRRINELERQLDDTIRLKDDLQRQVNYQLQVTEELREVIVREREETAENQRSIQEYKDWLAMHVLNYPAGCIDGKREFLGSCGIDWPIEKFRLSFIVPLGPQQRENFYDFSRDFSRMGIDWLEAHDINRDYIQYDYSNVEDEE